MLKHLWNLPIDTPHEKALLRIHRMRGAAYPAKAVCLKELPDFGLFIDAFAPSA